MSTLTESLIFSFFFVVYPLIITFIIYKLLPLFGYEIVSSTKPERDIYSDRSLDESSYVGSRKDKTADTPIKYIPLKKKWIKNKKI